MRLVLDYLIRNDLLKKLITFPCSIFTIFKNSDKVVITINKKNDLYILKHWNISSCTSLQALPSFKEYTTKDIFDNSHYIDHEILYLYHDVCLSYNTNVNILPINEELYFYYFDNFLNFKEYHLEKEIFLWKEFLKIYFMDIYFVTNHIFYWQNWTLKQQMNFIKENYKKIWKYWLNWNKYLLNSNKIPIELIISTLIRKHDY